MENSKNKQSVDLLQKILAYPAALLTEVGELALLTVQVMMWAIRPPYRFRVYLDAILQIARASCGAGSLCARPEFHAHANRYPMHPSQTALPVSR